MNGLNGMHEDDFLAGAAESSTFGLIVKAVGLDTAIKFVRFFGGCNLYVPREETISRASRDKKIREEFNGINYDDIAEKYCLSARQVRNIINRRGGI